MSSGLNQEPLIVRDNRSDSRMQTVLKQRARRFPSEYPWRPQFPCLTDLNVLRTNKLY